MNLAGIFLTRFVLGLRRWTPLPLFLPLTSSWENCLPRLQCNPHTIQNQLLTFGKGGAAARKSKWGRMIKPNPPAIAARMAPGSGPAPLGRRFKDKRGCGHLDRWAGGPSRKSSCVPKQKTAQSNTCNF